MHTHTFHRESIRCVGGWQSTDCYIRSEVSEGLSVRMSLPRDTSPDSIPDWAINALIRRADSLRRSLAD